MSLFLHRNFFLASFTSSNSSLAAFISLESEPWHRLVRFMSLLLLRCLSYNTLLLLKILKIGNGIALFLLFDKRIAIDVFLLNHLINTHQLRFGISAGFPALASLAHVAVRERRRELERACTHISRIKLLLQLLIASVFRLLSGRRLRHGFFAGIGAPTSFIVDL